MEEKDVKLENYQFILVKQKFILMIIPVQINKLINRDSLKLLIVLSTVLYLLEASMIFKK